MTLKSKSILWLVISLILTAGFFVLLYFSFSAGFTMWFSLSLLGGAILMMIAWICYYLASSRYKDSLNPKAKQKYHKKGNRKESRKAVNRIK